jgi:hypothetical protein
MSSLSEPLYTSPIYEADPASGSIVREYRDPQTGQPLYQVPSEAQLLPQTAQTGSAVPAPAAQTPAPAAAHTALYPSPEIEIDGATGEMILQYRDGTTGKAQYQVPSAAEIALYQETQARHDEPYGSVPKFDAARKPVAP